MTSRYRDYGRRPGSRTYLSRRDEFGMSEEEKHAAYLRRKAAAESAKKAGVGRPLMPYRPAGPTEWEKAHAAEQAQAQAQTAAQALARVVPEPLAPQTADMFADLVDEEEEEAGEAPAP